MHSTRVILPLHLSLPASGQLAFIVALAWGKSFPRAPVFQCPVSCLIHWKHYDSILRNECSSFFVQAVHVRVYEVHWIFTEHLSFETGSKLDFSGRRTRIKTGRFVCQNKRLTSNRDDFLQSDFGCFWINMLIGFAGISSSLCTVCVYNPCVYNPSGFLMSVHMHSTSLLILKFSGQNVYAGEVRSGEPNLKRGQCWFVICLKASGSVFASLSSPYAKY